MKRVVSSSLITLFILLVVAASFLYLRNFKNESGDPLSAIPADYSFFIIYDPGQLSPDSLLGEGPWLHVAGAPALNKIQVTIRQLIEWDKNVESFSSFFQSSTTVISAHVTGANDFDFLYLKRLPQGINEESIDKLIIDITKSQNKPTKRNYDGHTIRELSLSDGKIFTYAFSKGIFISSFTSFIVEDALRQIKVGKSNDKEINAISGRIGDSGLEVFVNFNKASSFLGIFTDSEKAAGLYNLRNFAGPTGAGVQIKNNQIALKGLITSVDSTSFLSCFKGQEPVEMKMLEILPQKSALVNYYGLSDINNFYNRFNKNYFSRDQLVRKNKILSRINSTFKIDIESAWQKWMGNEFAFVITEPSGMKFENNCFAVFRVSDKKSALKSLQDISNKVDAQGGFTTMEETYAGHTIRLVRLTGLLPALYGEIFDRVNSMFYVSLDNYIIFANQASAIRSYIDDYNKKKYLFSSANLRSVFKSLPSKGNHLFLVKPQASFYIFKSLANSEWKDYADQYRDVISRAGSVIYLMSSGEPDNWFNAAITFKESDMQSGVTSMFSIDADTSISMKPLLTTDPVVKSRQLLFQDDSGVLYMCDNSGNTIWKQDFPELIMGEIHEIDLFKNNTRQFLFNTRDYMYLIDVDGKPVGNYPIRLPAPATTGLSVLEFDGVKEPRIYVACENHTVYAYLPSGKPLPGWVFRELTGKVTYEIKKVSLGDRFYLFITDDLGNIFITKSFGEPGVIVNERAIIGDHTNIYTEPNGNILFTDYRGNVVRITSTGQLETIPLNAADSGHGFLFEDADDDQLPDYIFLNRTELLVYNSNLILLNRKSFENVMNGSLNLFELGNGEKVMSMNSDDANLTWLYDLKGNLIEGFPVIGSGIPVIDELNLDGNKNLFVGGKDNRLHVYSVK